MQRLFALRRLCYGEQPVDLRRAGEGDHIDPAGGHPIDQFCDTLLLGGRGIDIGQNRIGLCPRVPQKAGEPGLGSARVELYADLSAVQIERGQCRDQAVGRRRLGAQVGF